MSALDLPVSAERDSATHRAMEEAAEWFALLRSGEATAAEHGAWESWLAGSETHRNAWSYVERVSRRFGPIQASIDPRATAAVLQTAQGRLARRRQILLGMAALGGATLLGWATWRHTPWPAMAMAWMADHHTGVGETRELVLADGTRAWLGSASACNVDYQPGLRRLQLVAGEIFIETAADAARSFVVDTAHGRLRALGTRFNVRLDEKQTSLAVYEGTVEICPVDTATAMVVRVGQQTHFDQRNIAVAASADPARESWTRGVLIAQDLPLREVAAELARYRRGHLGVAPEVAGLRVYGSFPLHDTDRALAMLASVLPIQLKQPLPWWSTIEARNQKEGTPG